MAIGYAQMLGAGFALGAKYRKGAAEVEVMNVVGDVRGRTAVMVDDMVSTAGTVCDAARLLREQGAGDIYAVVSHCMIGQTGIARLKKSPINELITTDSIPLAADWDYPITVLSVAGLLGEGIRRVHENRSVTSLFKL
jgi:ribose-phosphate pyrophosphokinase